MAVDQMWAHSRHKHGERHSLAEHLRGTAALAGAFSEAFGASELAGYLGLVHDVGKGTCAWQTRLLEIDGTRERSGVPHKLAGTWLARQEGLGPFAAAVFGHHGGLPSTGQLRSELAHAEGDELHVVQEAVAQVSALVPEIRPPRSPQPPAWLGDTADGVAGELLLRMVFSALVDADYLDTEQHFSGSVRPRAQAAAALADDYTRRRKEYLAERDSSPVGKYREQVYAQAVAAADMSPGIFRMPAPTGSGKTIAAAGFAVHHAQQHRMRHVVVAVPFMSITEQNAGVYRRLLGEDNVLEHHSGIDLNRLGKGQRWQRLAAENWDAPFVVTTTVQLFESLFSNRPAAMRKLHRLARSVIVLDEVQALPDSLLLPILSVLRHLAAFFGTTVLLASATQPEFWELSPFRDVPVTEVIAEPSRLHAALRRVRYEWWLEPRPTLRQVAHRAAAEPRVLVIANTTADAAQLHRYLEATPAAGPVLHLSTRMAAAHRHAVLEDIVRFTGAEQPVTVVSTQLVEAGVDLDFPVVLRAFAPAESLQQAAGRANRNARMGEGLVIIFDPADGSQGASHIYGAALAATRAHFGPGKTARPDDQRALASYYRQRYDLKNLEEASTGARIEGLREKLDFPAVAAAFRMIDDTAVPVVTPYGDTGEHTRLLTQLRGPGPVPARAHRALRPYLASLPATVAQRALDAGLAVPVVGDLIEWRSDYHPQRGIDITSTEQEQSS